MLSQIFKTLWKKRRVEKSIKAVFIMEKKKNNTKIQSLAKVNNMEQTTSKQTA